MTVKAQRIAPVGTILNEDTIRAVLHEGIGNTLDGARVLVLIPDHTRTLPLPLLFRLTVEALADARSLAFMVALGTHPALSEESLLRLVGITAEERATTYRHVELLNHDWENPGALATIGTISRDEVQAVAGDAWHESLGGDVAIRLNRRALEVDHLLILGPVFPHEVVGFSGGAKYLFPGISSADMINVTHWLGALITILDTIGIAETPVRALIHRAADRVPMPIILAALVVDSKTGGLAGLFVGDHLTAWRAAAALSAERHIVWVDRPFTRALSIAPPMYDELWTAAKAMYKIEPALADGGEVIVYAPHLDTVSIVHGAHIYEGGYHVRDFYLKQWATYGRLPLGVLAHGTHLRGSGTYEQGVERARIQVTLATKISPADCERLSLGYADPASFDLAAWQGREAEGVLFVPKAGETLYRVRV